jgi:hypothetical protein
MAMNGWGAAEPAWWLNLQANADAVAELGRGIRRNVRGRAALGAERTELWDRYRDVDRGLDAYAARRPQETAIVVLEPATTDQRGPLRPACSRPAPSSERTHLRAGRRGRDGLVLAMRIVGPARHAALRALLARS